MIYYILLICKFVTYSHSKHINHVLNDDKDDDDDDNDNDDDDDDDDGSCSCCHVCLVSTWQHSRRLLQCTRSFYSDLSHILFYAWMSTSKCSLNTSRRSVEQHSLLSDTAVN